MTDGMCESLSIATRQRCLAVATTVHANGKQVCWAHSRQFYTSASFSKRTCARCGRAEPDVHFGVWQKWCDDCRAAARAKWDQRCSVCRKTGHVTADCPTRIAKAPRGRYCETCGSLPWRVEGERCAACGLPAGAEPAPSVDAFAEQRRGDPRV